MTTKKAPVGTFIKAKIYENHEGSMSLVLPEIPEEDLIKILPCVSIVTITKDRGKFASLMLYNWTNIKYPRDKLEWVIVDDSQEDEYNLADYIPQDDPYINYVKLKDWMPIDQKRNKAVSLAKYEYIVHMDDDDYYFPDHVLAKMRLLYHYNAQGVHSMPMGVYDMMEQTSFIFSIPVKNGFDSQNVAEATLAYRKDYWRQHPFKSTALKGTAEGAAFIGKNFGKWVNVHFLFNMISITHTKNITDQARRFINDNKDSVKTGNFEDVFPPEFNHLLNNLRKMLKE
jgi:glycosyltransferase involved in cell wall biosynthesis